MQGFKLDCKEEGRSQCERANASRLSKLSKLSRAVSNQLTAIGRGGEYVDGDTEFVDM
jgi:hypothetical protein